MIVTCPVCGSKFQKRQPHHTYCGAECAVTNRRKHYTKKRAVHKPVPFDRSVWLMSRRIYCKELKRSFLSVVKASRLIGMSPKAIRNTLANVRTNQYGLTFEDYNPDIHPAPR